MDVESADQGVVHRDGNGLSGIAYGFDVFAQRLHSARLERYAAGAARYLESLINARIGSIPEQPHQRGWDTGYLSGAAGDAFMFLRLYHHTHNVRWLRDARTLLHFVDQTGHVRGHQESWPIEVDPSGAQANDAVALGTEEGNAGIAWTMLNAYEVTGRVRYLRVARRAGTYLVDHLTAQRRGRACVEDVGSGHTRLFHTGLDNGAAGCAFVLHDLALVTGDHRYAAAARALVGWLAAVAHRDRDGVWWYDQHSARTRRWANPREMSWHWGQAGIVALLARMSGWTTSMPVEQPSIMPLTRG